jgi:cytochrome c oxidase cbb3-type subunit 2
MQTERIFAGWRGVALVAVTYAYFLIFAQFGFLARLSELGVPAAALTPVMTAMATAGILFSLVTPRVIDRLRPSTLVRVGLVISASAALLALVPAASMLAVPIALLIGAGLGILTVALVTHLASWCGSRATVLVAGIGTGLGYAFCNVPAVFAAKPSTQAVIACGLCIVGIAVATVQRAELVAPEPVFVSPPFLMILTAFAALVWLDSAAFFIIQHTALLKAGTWTGTGHLWINAAVHFVAAVIAAFLLRSRHFLAVLSVAVLALGGACLLLAHPASILSASVLYPAGVSLYSVALVAYPSSLSGATSLSERAHRAGWLYAVAGWIGSALGIGMGQHLGLVPSGFVALAAAVVLLPALRAVWTARRRELLLLAGALACVVPLWRVSQTSAADAMLSAEERGRRVYIAEGCISCHSQYVRPNSPDEQMWGPSTPVEQVRAQTPPLIGNRRQGPDLAEVGARRSPFWLRAHLMDPAALSDHSPMPSYAFLFADGRGEDLVSYLASLHSTSAGQVQMQVAWRPSDNAWGTASVSEGERLYGRACATCHDDRGAARLRWQGEFHKPPPERDALLAFAQSEPRDALAHIVRFGMPGTDMPGHEVLADRDVASLVLWLKSPVLRSATQ